MCLAERFITKLQHRINVHNNTWADWRALISSAIYGATALDISLGHAFHLLKWLAHHTMTHGEHNVVMWTSAAAQWLELTTTILNNNPSVPIFSTSNIGMTFDATTESELSVAIVVFPSGCWKAASFRHRSLSLPSTVWKRWRCLSELISLGTC